MSSDSAAGVAPWQAHDRVGPYSLLTKLAVGGMAEIWLARQPGLRGFEKLVVVKKMADSLCEDPDFVEMFLDEARIAAQLSHPNIVQIFDLGEHAGSYYIAMEYLNGENLAHVVRTGLKHQKPLEIPLAVRILATAAEGLAHAHTKRGQDGSPLNIVHRDVSPQNLIVTYDGVVKLVDFGIAKAANRSSHTMGNQLKGKASYMSPEQARGQPIDARADVFALGVVLYETLARVRLFHFEDTFQALAAITGDTPIVAPSVKNAKIPAELDAIVLKALSRNREQRFQSARELQGALEAWLHKQSVVPGTEELAAYMHVLFHDRIAQRARLIDTARQGDLTPGSISPGLIVGTPHSRMMPGGTDPGLRTVVEPLPAPAPAASAPPTPSKWPLRLGIAAGVIATLGAAGIAVALSRVPPAAPPDLSALKADEPAELTIETDPPGAAISVDGKSRGASPLTASDLPLGEHVVQASLDGRDSARRVVQLHKPGERLQIFLALAAVAKPAGADATRPPPPPAAVSRGKLTLVTTPWAHVFMGGRSLGDTPLVEISLPTGKHVLRMVNEEAGVKSSIEVEISPGKLTVKKLHL